jgi:hypothetical protein
MDLRKVFRNIIGAFLAAITKDFHFLFALFAFLQLRVSLSLQA